MLQRVGLATFGLALVLGTLALAQETPNADTHKTWMNDAADAQEDFRAAIAAANAKDAATTLTKIEGFMAKTEAYWAAKKMADGVKLTRAARSHASSGAAAANAGKLADAADAFDKMNAACNACHELHLEKR